MQKVTSVPSDMIVVAGDLTNNDEIKYYSKLKRLTIGHKVLWAKGNHDGKNFKTISELNYYYDIDNWRFITLDTSQKFGTSTGYLNGSQISSLKKWLQTEQNVIVVIHHAPFFYDTRNDVYTSEKAEPYFDFFDALTPNAKYVLSGH